MGCGILEQSQSLQEVNPRSHDVCKKDCVVISAPKPEDELLKHEWLFSSHREMKPKASKQRLQEPEAPKIKITHDDSRSRPCMLLAPALPCHHVATPTPLRCHVVGLCGERLNIEPELSRRVSIPQSSIDAERLLSRVSLRRAFSFVSGRLHVQGSGALLYRMYVVSDVGFGFLLGLWPKGTV